jgi:hypothetical protein
MIEGCGASILIRTASGSQPSRKPPLPISCLNLARAGACEPTAEAGDLGEHRPTCSLSRADTIPRMRVALPLLRFFRVPAASSDDTVSILEFLS